MSDALRNAIYQRPELADLDPTERRLALRSLAVEEGIDALNGVGQIADEIDGLGVLTEIMSDDAVTDVLVNGPDEVWVERAGALVRTDVRFADGDSLEHLIERLLGRAGVRIDRSHPIADARLVDGSRIHAVLPPIAPLGPLVSIRRFPPTRFSLDDLVARSMLSPGDAQRLHSYVLARRSIVIGGRTGTGKSTLLDALLSCVPDHERVVTIEELPELRPATEHRVSLVARGPNVEGKGAISLDRLVRAALRMRPDRIVVGEVRGPEALSALEAMGTGHEGSMLTVHARSHDGVRDRLLTLALQAASGVSETSLFRQIDAAVDVFVHLERDETGGRRVSDICTAD